MRLHNGIKVFSQDDMFRVHEAALRILEEIGLEMVVSDGALARLEGAGLRVERSTHRVRFPRAVVLETIQQFSGAPSPEITPEGSAMPPQPLRMPTRLRPTMGANSGYVYDYAQRRMRPASRRDVLDVIKVKRRLRGIEDGNSSLYPQDVPQPVAAVHATALACVYCPNPAPHDVQGIEDLPWVERVMQAAGAWSPGRHLVVPIYPVSPLRLAGRGAALMEWQAARGDLAVVLGMVIPGASAPITLVAQVEIALAEEFGFSTAYRLLVDPPGNRYTPRSIGDDVCILDLRRGAYALAAPEVVLLRLAMHQMAGEFYRLPGHSDHGIRFISDAQEPGAQANLQNGLMAMADLCQGVYSYDEDVTCTIGILGLLGSGLMLSLEQAVLDLEMVGFLERLLQGIRVDEETLAFDLIREVGPGGSFLACEHTARHVREEMWFPQFWHRGAWDAWVATGRRSPLDLAHEQVQEWLGEDLEPVLDSARLRDVERVVREAERALLGHETGIQL
jgi:trimethylamine--corrinoid protein Co-methyltransferase